MYMTVGFAELGATIDHKEDLKFLYSREIDEDFPQDQLGEILVEAMQFIRTKGFDPKDLFYTISFG
jgi:hypothetical protein